MKSRWFLIWLVMATVATAADYTQSEAYRSVIESHFIEIHGQGTVNIPFPAARDLFESDRILDIIQESYADLLPKGEEPEFVVEAAGTNAWHYTNRKQETSRILELHRSFTGDLGGHLVFYTEGQRFFGTFRAIIDIHVSEAGPEEDACTYKVIVYAYPENAVSRFFARHLGIAERYFHQKTKDITALSIAISKHLLSLNPARIESHMLVGQERHRQRPERSCIMPGVVIG